MKLFAIATAATAGVNAGTVFDKYQPYRYQRVGPTDFPGPGHINEQGGYWADQPTVQSNSYVQPGQPALPQPPHQQQGNQCCSRLKFTDVSTGEDIIFTANGMNDSKTKYSGVNQSNGVSSMLFWSFDDTTFHVPEQYIPGKWIIGHAGMSFTVIRESKKTTGLSSCPDSQENGSIHDGWIMTCEQEPHPVQLPQTCDAANTLFDQRGVWKDFQSNGVCRLDNLMEIIIRPQFNQFKSMNLNSQAQREIETYYSDALNAYRDMTGNQDPNRCGADSDMITFEHNLGWANVCHVICNHSGDLNKDSQADFEGSMHQFFTVVSTMFVDNMFNAMNDLPEDRNFCENRLAFFWRALQNIENLVAKEVPAFKILDLNASNNNWQIRERNQPRSLGPE